MPAPIATYPQKTAAARRATGAGIAIDSTDRYHLVDGLERTLAGAPRGGPRVLLLHGLQSSGATWWRIASSASPTRGADVTAPDLRGHGASPRGERYRLARLRRRPATGLGPRRRPLARRRAGRIRARRRPGLRASRRAARPRARVPRRTTSRRSSPASSPNATLDAARIASRQPALAPGRHPPQARGVGRVRARDRRGGAARQPPVGSCAPARATRPRLTILGGDPAHGALFDAACRPRATDARRRRPLAAPRRPARRPRGPGCPSLRASRSTSSAPAARSSRPRPSSSTATARTPGINELDRARRDLQAHAVPPLRQQGGPAGGGPAPAQRPRRRLAEGRRRHARGPGRARARRLRRAARLVRRAGLPRLRDRQRRDREPEPAPRAKWRACTSAATASC